MWRRVVYLLAALSFAGCTTSDTPADARRDLHAADLAAGDLPPDTRPDQGLPDLKVPDSAPAVCGDGVINGSDKCDGKQLGGKTCASLGLGGGTLTCTGKCAFDLSGCTWAVVVSGAEQPSYSAIGVDSSGHVRFGGMFIGSVTLGGTTYNATSPLSRDIFLASLTPDGGYSWVKVEGNGGARWAMALALDPAGPAYLAGSYSSSATFGGKTITTSGMSDPFLVKVEAAGSVKWAMGLDGGKYQNSGSVVAVAGKQGNAYLAGSFQQMLTFGKDHLTTTPYTNLEYFAVAADSQGKALWARKITKTGPLSAASASAQGLALAGQSGVERLSAAGKQLWAVDLSKQSLVCRGVALDSAGNTCLTGYFANTVTLGSTTLASKGGKDIFVARLDPTGKVLWAKGFGHKWDDQGAAAVASAGGACTVTGSYHGNATFGAHTLTSAGGVDLFVVRFTAAGVASWATSGGGPDLEAGAGLAVDSKGNSFVQGWSTGKGTFGGAKLSSGTGSMVIWKINASGK